jgi:hypothetical protein
MQIALMAVIAEGWLLIEIKFLKSLRFFKSSESVLLGYSKAFYLLISADPFLLRYNAELLFLLVFFYI